MVAVVLMAAGATSGWAAEKVDLLLVLAADVSRSIDSQKFRLQREGYAAALADPHVLKAIESGPLGRIAVCFVEWSGPGAQTVVIDWTAISGAKEADDMAERVRNAPRLFMESTAIGAALDFSVRQLERAPYEAERQVIDVSGDGASNTGRNVVAARADALARGVTINGLVILSDTPLMSNPTHTHPPGGLLAYYENNVVGGPGAFAMATESFEAFGTALAAKLAKEIASAGQSFANQERRRLR